jgi:hypothetical protein
VVTAGGPLYNSGCRIFPLLAILANIAILSAPSCRCLCLGEARRFCLGLSWWSPVVNACVLWSPLVCSVCSLLWSLSCVVALSCVVKHVRHVATLVALSCVVAVNVIVSRQQRVCVVVALSCVVAVNVIVNDVSPIRMFFLFFC